MDWPVTYTRKVRYSDTDAQGIAFNGNYATYFDDTITDLFGAIGYRWGEVEVVLARMEIDFRSPARLGETIVTGARVERVGKTSLTIRLATWEEREDRPVADATQIQVVVSGEDFRPIPVPDDLIAAIEAVQGAVER
jgi:acyl-CoA thioester hydrolase